MIAISHGTADNITGEAADEGTRIYAASENPGYLRSRQQVEALFTGLELLPPWQGAGPGITAPAKWAGPDTPPGSTGAPANMPDAPVVLWCGVARKPLPS